jgi:hypothetical protein
MQIRVECYAGYRNEEEPRAFWLGERRLEVGELVDRWLSPEHRYFKVKATDGDFYILRHDEARGIWELGAFTRSQTATARGQIPKGPHSPKADDPE